MYSPIFSDEIHIFLQDPRALTLVPSRTLADGPRMGFFITSFKHQKWQNKRNRAASLVAFCRNETCRNEITFYLAEITGMFRGFQDPPATTIPWLLVESFCFLRWKITKNWQTIDFTIRNMGISWEFTNYCHNLWLIKDGKLRNWPGPSRRCATHIRASSRPYCVAGSSDVHPKNGRKKRENYGYHLVI